MAHRWIPIARAPVDGVKAHDAHLATAVGDIVDGIDARLFDRSGRCVRDVHHIDAHPLAIFPNQRRCADLGNIAAHHQHASVDAGLPVDNLAAPEIIADRVIATPSAQRFDIAARGIDAKQRRKAPNISGDLVPATDFADQARGGRPFAPEQDFGIAARTQNAPGHRPLADVDDIQVVPLSLAGRKKCQLLAIGRQADLRRARQCPEPPRDIVILRMRNRCGHASANKQ